MFSDQTQDEVIVKISGRRDLVESIVDNLRDKYYATLSSPYRDSDGGGVFVYVKVLGEKT